MTILRLTFLLLIIILANTRFFKIKCAVISKRYTLFPLNLVTTAQWSYSFIFLMLKLKKMKFVKVK